MRIVLDLQGAQSTGSRNRGIGRYTLSLAQAIARNRGDHEVILALNGLFPETIESIRAAFDKFLPQDNIRVWQALSPVNQNDHSNDSRRKIVELMREAFLSSLNPDVVHVSSLFEGLSDDAISSVGCFAPNMPTAITLYDLIPHIYRKPYLENPIVEKWYDQKLNYLSQAHLWLAISESSRLEGIEQLGLSPQCSINISTAAEEHFRPIIITEAIEEDIRRRYGLTRQFAMYTGGIDHRKNIEGLIRAYAHLPKDLRDKHQLAIVCSVHESSRQTLDCLVAQCGLNADEVVLTGFVPEEDLVALYNLCKVFVFPSWHEGFGLPALEAMQCGAAVIGANSSSLPEVIGCADALFDARSDDAITEKLSQVLIDEGFRNVLKRHGLEQAKKFTWDRSGCHALAAFEQMHVQTQRTQVSVPNSGARPKLAYVSPLPPERTGIADYSAELLPELAKYYDLTVVVEQGDVRDPWVIANCAIQSSAWLRENSSKVDRVLYHFGNSPFHQHMFALLEDVPGIVVLHEFYLGHIQSHLESSGIVPHALTCALYHGHGYAAVRERYLSNNDQQVLWNFPANLSVLQQAQGIIVHSENCRVLARQWYGETFADDWAVIPHLRVPEFAGDKGESRNILKLQDDCFVVCSFGLLGSTKLNHRLLDAWKASSLSKDERCVLVFVGELPSGEYGSQLLQNIHDSGLKKRIRITGWADVSTFRNYLAAADVAVQLRTLSRGETSGTVLDCMNNCLPTIINAHGTLADFPKEAVWLLPDEFEDVDLIQALEKLWQDIVLRTTLGNRARDIILNDHSPRGCGEKYIEAIELFNDKAGNGVSGLLRNIGGLDNLNLNDNELMSVAEAVSQNFPLKNAHRQLLLDISVLVQFDAKSGIQRVVRSILMELINNPPDGYRVEPVYANPDRQGYRYAREFTSRFINCPIKWADDSFIDYQNGDIFIGLDLAHHVVVTQESFLKKMQNQGVRLYFVVYDLLPIIMPNMFEDGIEKLHETWLHTITKFDGALCISHSVAEELNDWIMKNGLCYSRLYKVDWFHLGADIENSVPSNGLRNDGKQILNLLSIRPSFLSVGTIEPRKGQLQTLNGFEILWKQGVDVNLVFVGKAGWKVEALFNRLKNHPEKGRRLFWLEEASDELLEKIYGVSTCLIAASEGEGFGLPLIEAAQHNLPVIARNIPVFIEVAGENSFYFEGKQPGDLAGAVSRWLELYKNVQHPKSDKMPWLTWKQSAQQLINIVMNNKI